MTPELLSQFCALRIFRNIYRGPVWCYYRNIYRGLVWCFFVAYNLTNAFYLFYRRRPIPSRRERTAVVAARDHGAAPPAAATTLLGWRLLLGRLLPWRTRAALAQHPLGTWGGPGHCFELFVGHIFFNPPAPTRPSQTTTSCPRTRAAPPANERNKVSQL